MPIAGDRSFEPAETFAVTLSAPTGGATITTATATATGTITNDDFPPAANAFINEFHYDTTGGDSGEFVEIAGLAGTDLSGWTLALYNGGNGGVYATLALGGVLGNQAGGFGFASVAATGLQNGSPDELPSSTNLGVYTVPQLRRRDHCHRRSAAGRTSVDIGVGEESAAVGTSLQLVGSGSSYSDFRWVAGQASTNGGANSGQSFRSGTDVGELRIDDARVVEGTGGTSVLTFTVARAGGFASAASVEYAINFNGAATPPTFSRAPARGHGRLRRG